MLLLLTVVFATPILLVFLGKKFIDKLMPCGNTGNNEHYINELDVNCNWGPNSDIDEEEEKNVQNLPAIQLAKSKRPFTISIPDEQISDLKWRLENMRDLTPSLELIAHEYGINSVLLQKIVDFWKTKYDWKQREIYLNHLPQYKMNIQGLDIHFIHVQPDSDKLMKSPQTKEIVPLLLVHSWPGSIREFYKIIQLYTTPRTDKHFVFEIIAPHIPGFGFSQATNKPGLGPMEIAIIFQQLMKKLNFDKYYCQGGGLGAIILQSLCVLYPGSILGYHTTMPYIVTKRSLFKYILSAIWPSAFVRHDHYNRVFPLIKRIKNFIKDYGFITSHINNPDTLGVALNDSPIGLAAYILDKFIIGTRSSWKSRMDGGLLEKYTFTDLLDIIMIYWWSGTATTSLRLFSETFNKKQWATRSEIIIPVAIARFKHDFYTPDGILKEIFPNLKQLNDYNDGGHYPAMELPNQLANDVFNAVKKFEIYNKYFYAKDITDNEQQQEPELEQIQQGIVIDDTNHIRNITEYD